MNGTRLSDALREVGAADTVDEARQSALAAEFSVDAVTESNLTQIRRLSRLGYVYEVQGLNALKQWSVNPEKIEEHRQPFRSAVACWLALTSSLEREGSSQNKPIAKNVLSSLTGDLGLDIISPNLSLAFHLAASGILAEQTAETRLHLKRFGIVEDERPENWLGHVLFDIVAAFVCLVRKDGGWQDINYALHALEKLRSAQAKFEEDYLNSHEGVDRQTRAAMSLVAFYHLAQLVTVVGDYVRTGEGGRVDVGLRLDMHRRQAMQAFELASENARIHFADLLWAACKEVVKNSLWSHIEGLPDNVRYFGQKLIQRDHPVLELWPSQQEALKKSLLDPYQRAIMVEMPTSAGKTLLAKFSIVQTKALNPNSTIAYVVPTRALVNQITFDLRQDFRPLNFRIELAVPAFELDPTEAALLAQGIDVLVTTPEKLDLLLRVDHPAVKDLSLIVADEAHNIGDGHRGARLELLLGMIKRERRNARFLLLSPFLPNGNELVTWLGEERALPPIQVHWKPSKKIVGAVLAHGRQTKRRLVLEVLPSADNAALKIGTKISIGKRDAVPEKLSKGKLTRSTAKAMGERGGVLVLCRGKGTSIARAKEIAGDVTTAPPLSELGNAVCEYLTAEAGYETGLVKCIQKGVAFHHSGMSHEARWLVEALVRRGEIKVVCGTTTLAQGVNFPISTVIVETLRKGEKTLSYSDFWNVAGRAGRALVDTLGIVAFPSPSLKKKAEVIDFLKGEAEQIASQLATLLVAAEHIGDAFNLANIRKHPELSSLLQFLAHAVRVSERDNIADEMESLLRSSLIYHQARKADETALNRFIDLCRAYVRQVTAGQRGLLSLADKTGFATPSVLYLVARTKSESQLFEPDNWSPDKLFGENIDYLRRRIELIAEVPEMRLGDGTGAPLDALRTASIIRDWVNGESLFDLASKYAISDREEDEGEEIEGDDYARDKNVSAFSSYLFSTLIGNASWGLGALEGLCLPNLELEGRPAAHIPSMVYFGVMSAEAVWMRMAGVPRIAAEGAGNLWKHAGRNAPQSYEEIRSWVSSLSDTEWKTALPSHTPVSPKSMKLVLGELCGAL